MWETSNGMPFGHKFQQPACTSREFVGTSCFQFFSKIEGSIKLEKCATNVEKAASERSKVEYDMCSLIF